MERKHPACATSGVERVAWTATGVGSPARRFSFIVCACAANRLP
nr:hypothetical protein [Candidatus Freyarchaeota archaeon]